MTLSPTNFADVKLVVLNLVRTDDESAIASGSAKAPNEGTLLLNLPAEADPKLLHESMHQAIQYMEERLHVRITLNRLEACRPARPQLIHRIGKLDEV